MFIDPTGLFAKAIWELMKGAGGSAIDGIQTGLDVIGLAPFVGEVADGTNALISLGRGNYGDTALSAGAMIPFVGWASTGTKFGKKAIKHSDEVTKLIKGAPEPEVQSFINQFEKKFPGREYKSGHKLPHSDGRKIEIDFETDNVILEFKKGKGKGLKRQVSDRMDSVLNPNRKVVIGVPGSKMSKHALKDVESVGGLMTNDIDLLLELLK